MAVGQPGATMGHGYVFPRGQLMPEERLMFLIALVVVGSVGGAFALATIHAEAASSRWWALWEGFPSACGGAAGVGSSFPLR